MIIATNITQFNPNHIYIYNPVKNNIMEDSKFIRIIYSNVNLILNGVYIEFDFVNDVTCENYFNKFKYSFDVNSNKDLINKIKTIEEQIMSKLSINKTPKYQIYEQLNTGNLKLFTPSLYKNSRYFILKISGFWETDIKYGLTYKFINGLPYIF